MKKISIYLILVFAFLFVPAFISTVKNAEAERACTLEAKVCPDGSAVGRQGSNCEFAPCPGEKDEDGDKATKTPTDDSDDDIATSTDDSDESDIERTSISSTPEPIPVTGFSWPTVLGIAVGLLLIVSSVALII